MIVRLALVAPSLAIAACGGAAAGGPLQERFDHTDRWRLCAPSEPGDDVTFALIYVSNESSEPMTITGVTVADEDGLSFIDAVIAPVSVDLMAADFGWPPESVDADEWVKTRPVVGASIGHELELVSIGLHVDRLGTATASGVTVQYTLGDRSFRAVHPVEFVVKRRC